MVPTERLELSQLSPPPPQDGVSTNFTTSAWNSICDSNARFARRAFYYFGTLPDFGLSAVPCGTGMELSCTGAAGAGAAGVGTSLTPSITPPCGAVRWVAR